MKQADLKGATEEELLTYCRPTALERLLPRTVIPLAALLSLTLVGGVGYWTFTDGSEGTGAMVIGVVMVLVLLGACFASVLSGAFWLLGMAGRRSAGARAELRRRCGQAGFDEDLRQERERPDRDAAPDYTIFFTGKELPGGRSIWVRLDLHLGGQGSGQGVGRAEVETRVGPLLDLKYDDNPLARVERRRVTYELPSDAELLRFLQEIEPKQLRSVKSCFINGMPCEIALLCRGSNDVYRGGCNYVEQDDRRESAPVMRLVEILLNLTRAQSAGGSK